MSKETTPIGSRSRGKSRELRGKVEELDTARGTVEVSPSIAEVLAGTPDAVENVALEAGLLIMKAVIDEEVEPLSGRRYERVENRQAYRWGQGESHVVFAGRKIPFRRPPVRSSEGKQVPPERLRLFQRSGRMQEAVAHQVILGVSMRDYEKAVDGVEFGGQVLTVSLGLSSDGAMHVLGLWRGATEHSVVLKELFAEMIRRGLDPEAQHLFVLDGSKALREAMRNVFGEEAPIQRCVGHKRRNVPSHLPKRYHFTYTNRLRIAWSTKSYGEAKKELEAIVEDLEAINETAGRSLKEGLEETLTLSRLRVPERVRRSLASTNLIENCFSATRKFTRNVKNYKNRNMVLR